MTLQYETRWMEEDRKLRERIRQSKSLLLETVDRWCRTNADFPMDATIASILYLFSPRCDPLDGSEDEIERYLSEEVGTPTTEYTKTWPKRADERKSELIDTISHVLSTAVNRWSDGSLLNPAVETVNQEIVDHIVAQQYIVFHHYQTTRRDVGGFHSND